MPSHKALVLAAAAAVPALVAAAHNSYPVTGADILNFALNLECLEAEFYSWAAFGEGLSDELRGGGPPSDGGMMANLTTLGKDSVFGAAGIAKELAEDEIAHVRFLRAALGGDAVACPKMDIGPAFAAAANAAAGAALEPAFDPYANDLFFLHGAFIFEDVGVTAYNGAVPAATALLPAEVVQAAASILGVESYHAGAIRTLLSVAAFQAETPYGNVTDVVQLISDLRDAVDSAEVDADQGILRDGMLNIVPTDDNGLVFARSVPQVLNIVYLGGETEGGFFPEGINGVFGELTREELNTALEQLAMKLAGGDMPSMAPMMTSGDDMMAPMGACPPCPACDDSDDMAPTASDCEVPLYGQCGGREHMGCTNCEMGTQCMMQNEWYSQCLMGGGDAVAPLGDSGDMGGYGGYGGDAPVSADCPAAIYEQCGGREHMGCTSCEDGTECMMQNEWYSQCLPMGDDAMAPMGAYGGDAPAPVSDCPAPVYSQCGGREHTGCTTCENGTQCVMQNEWYSQCLPTGTDFTPGGDYGSYGGYGGYGGAVAPGMADFGAGGMCASTPRGVGAAMPAMAPGMASGVPAAVTAPVADAPGAAPVAAAQQRENAQEQPGNGARGAAGALAAAAAVPLLLAALL